MPFYDYYDDLQATGVGRSWARAQARNVLHRLRAARPEARTVLEVGPGHGSFAAACASAGLCYTALDINLRLLRGLQAAGYSGVRAMAPSLPLAPGQYDIAFASHVIEHSPTYRDALAFAAEVGRVVVPGGLVALVAPDYLALGDDFWNCDYSHGFVTTRRRLRQLLRDAGLTVRSTEYLWGPLQGLEGAVAGLTIGSRLAGAVARSVPGRTGERLYKARLTFARAILVIAEVSQ
jgi:SAM-dependent methyltransferase